MVSCTTPVSQSKCRDSRSTSTKGNKCAHCITSCLTLVSDIDLAPDINLWLLDVVQLYTSGNSKTTAPHGNQITEQYLIYTSHYNLDLSVRPSVRLLPIYSAFFCTDRPQIQQEWKRFYHTHHTIIYHQPNGSTTVQQNFRGYAAMFLPIPAS